MPLLIGTSWKMNLTASQAEAWFDTFVPLARDLADVDLFVLPPFPALWLARERLAGTGIAWGAQDVSPFDDGQHTGGVSAAMLADLGCRYVEVGHAEQRRDHGETPTLIAAKIKAVLDWGMDVILCTGEPDRAPVAAAIRGVVEDLERCLVGIGASELGRIVVAYEPVWAIGEGRRPAAPERVGQVQRAIAERLGSGRDGVRPRIVYGGSVDPISAPQLLAEPGIDGLFVGRHGLDPVAFAAIAAAPMVLQRAQAS
jgi:triosephosphate isomerase